MMRSLMATLRDNVTSSPTETSPSASLDGTWYCANFFGDCFELTSFADGGLIVQMGKKRRAKGVDSVRLEPRSHGCWEAVEKLRLRQHGNDLLFQRYKNGFWAPEVRAFRELRFATGHYFRDLLGPRRKDVSSKEFLIKRESSTVFNVKPFDAEVAFEVRDHHNMSDACLYTENFELDDAEECKICMASQANVVLLPCGHSGFCEMCVWRMISQNDKIGCPFCRQSIARIAKVDASASQTILTDENTKPIQEWTGERRIAWQ